MCNLPWGTMAKHEAIIPSSLMTTCAVRNMCGLKSINKLLNVNTLCGLGYALAVTVFKTAPRNGCIFCGCKWDLTSLMVNPK